MTGPIPSLLALGTKVTVEGSPEAAEIVRRAGTDQRPILRLAGIANRAAAEALRGRSVTVAVADLPELPAGEYWAHELEGCRVFDGERPIGIVVRLVELPSCEALEIRASEGERVHGSPGERVRASEPAERVAFEPEVGRRRTGPEPLLVPMVKDAIRGIDVGAGRIDVDMGFIEGD